MGDLKDARLMYLKAVLFLVIGLMAVAGLLVASPNWQTTLLLGLAIWSFCRLYYFMFYVIEKYVDGNYKFAGITSFLIYLVNSPRGERGRGGEGDEEGEEVKGVICEP